MEVTPSQNAPPGTGRPGLPPSWTYALLGGSALVLQTLFLREFLALFHRSELFAGAVLGVWLVLVGAGSALGEFASRRLDAARALASLYAIIGLGSLGAVPFLRWLPGALGVAPGTLPPITAAVGIAATAMLVPCLLVGASFSLTAAVRGDAGRVYMWDAVGGLAGGLLVTALIVLFAPDAMLVCSVLAIAFGFLAWRWGRACRGRLWQAPGVAVGTLAVSLLIWWPARATLEKGTLRHVFEPETISAWAETSEGRWVITLAGEGTRNLYVGGALAWSEADASAVEEFAALAALSHPDPGRILVLAAPADPLPRKLASACPGAKVRAVVPSAGALSRALEVDATPAVEFVRRDARAYLRSGSGDVDLIAYRPGAPHAFATSRLVSREAFAEIRRTLAPGGLLALGLPFATSYQNQGVRKVISSVVGAVASEFETVRLETLPHAGIVILASAEAVPGPDAIRERYAARAGRLPSFRPELLGSAEERQFNLDDLRRAVVQARGRANSDLLPSAIWYQARVTGTMYGKESALARLEPGTPWPGVVFVAILMLACLVPARTGRAWGAGGGVALAAGAAGMLLEVTILCAYQVTCGALYGEVAVLLGLVMAGTALGAHASERRAAHVVSASPGRKVLVCACGVAPAVLLALLMLLAPGLLGRPLLWGLALATGAAVGAAYPLALAFTRAADREPRAESGAASKAVAHSDGAGYVLAADLAGAAAGSILGGGLLVPLLGLNGTALTGLAIALVAAGAVLLAKAKR